MFTNLKIRTGILVSLALLFTALLLSILTGWYFSLLSDQDMKRVDEVGIAGANNLQNAYELLLLARLGTVRVYNTFQTDPSSSVAHEQLERSAQQLSEAEQRIQALLPLQKYAYWKPYIFAVYASFENYRQALLNIIANLESGITLEYPSLDDQAFERYESFSADVNTFREHLNTRMVQNMADADQRYELSRNLSVLFCFIALSLITVSVRFVSNYFLKPLQDTLEHFRFLKAGDLSQTMAISVNNEIGILQRALMDVQQAQRTTIQQITDSATQLAASAEELHAITEESNQGLQQQNNELEQAVTAVTEMTSAAEEVARNASEVSGSSKEANTLAHNGSELSEKTLQEVAVMAQDILKSSQQVESLAEEANRISTVLEVIRSVSDQTNLLALNAAIEAARAGEAGRGFSVVADEVRMLAQRTQKSTEEIEDIILSIQKGTQSTVEAMNASRERVQLANESTHSTSQALNNIFTAMNRIAEGNLSIASAAEEQAQVSREIDKNLIQIRDLSIQASSGAHQTSVASQQLSRLALELENMVNRFKL